jgi:ABC-type multidrug transport system permease subunit
MSDHGITFVFGLGHGATIVAMAWLASSVESHRAPWFQIMWASYGLVIIATLLIILSAVIPPERDTGGN